MDENAAKIKIARVNYERGGVDIEMPALEGSDKAVAVMNIDLTTAKMYTLADLFKKDAKYEDEILKIAKANDDYRIVDNDIDFDESKETWGAKKKRQHSMLTEEFLWVFAASPDGSLMSGYGIPYADLDKVIDKGGALWKAFSGQKSRARDTEYFMKAPPYDVVENDGQVKPRQAGDGKKTPISQESSGRDKSTPEAVTWEAKKVVKNDNGTLLITGPYINNFSDRTMMKVEAALLTILYKTKDGIEKHYSYQFGSVERVVPPKGSTDGGFNIRPPADFAEYLSAANDFEYSWKK